MNLKDLDLVKLSKLTSQQIDHVTCLECCKYYIAPATAGCGHTLCHTCWRGRRTCPTCATQLERKALKLNLPLQTLTDHVQVLGEAFEKLFNIKLDEFNLDTPDELESVKDPDKHVKDWLTSSQNHFSAPIQNSETLSQDFQPPPNPLEVSASNIIIHTDTKKVQTPPKVVHVPPPQDDWDKIEPMPDPEETNKKHENIVGPMDIEPFFVDDIEYNMHNPRRSSRKRDLKNDNAIVKVDDLSANICSSRESSCENDKKSQKTKQTWNNVKRMRKEFSKLNKKNRNKLNVSIEMVKKTQNLKANFNTPTATSQVYNIDDNTPANTNKENENVNIISLEPIDKQLGGKATEKKNNDIKSKNEPTLESQIALKCLVEKNNIKGNDLKYSENSNRNQDPLPEPMKMPFIKRGALNPRYAVSPYYNNSSDKLLTSENNEDIEISIKVGNTITNIVIKKKQSDVQVKINTDREVQTSLGPHCLGQSNRSSPSKGVNTHNIDINIENPSNQEPAINIQTNDNIKPTDLNLNKSTSGKKNTASADTATVQFEITESVEKELSNIMECDIIPEKSDSPKNFNKGPVQVQNAETNIEPVENIENLNDLDIFNSGSVKEANVHILNEHAPSEILISTVRSKFKSQKLAEKRDRDIHDEEENILPTNKKVKMNSEAKSKCKDTPPDSEPINYDSVMGQVFANIDADMEDIRKSQEVEGIRLKDTENNKNNKIAKSTKTSQVQPTQVLNKVESQRNNEITQNLNEYFNDKHSENIFSILEKEDEISGIGKIDKLPQQVDDMLTPVLCRNLESTQESRDGLDKSNKRNKKTQDYDDSDKSVVEETPQKNISFSKLKRASTSNQSQVNLSETKKNSLKKSASNIRSVINLTDTVAESNKSNKNVTVIETAAQNQALETPLTISKFADQIKHKSTPMARKSLNFEIENDDNDPEQTLCPTTDVIAKTTQEREFMNKVFDRTPKTPALRLAAKNIGLNANKKYCLAGSCLTSGEIAKVKVLCNERKWSYVDKFTKDITHLIVGVDEEKKSQRSVKYMCALAASKWIVSFEWIKVCLQTKEIVNEEYYEALDSTGEPGPRRSRIARQKLFQGITFYCMPPFSVLDVDTLQSMLLAAGGHVVYQANDLRISEESYEPALLLAEPENTQEDRFIYLAMEQGIVPVNYEWVLNCLGNYTLGSVQELLLCPSSLLPAATAKWPEVLLSQDYD